MLESFGCEKKISVKKDFFMYSDVRVPLSTRLDFENSRAY